MKKITFILLLFLFSFISSNVYPYLYDINKDGHNEVRDTWYAWQKAFDLCGVQLPHFSSPKLWYQAARDSGLQTSTTPRANSIVVYTSTSLGHVAFVTSYDGTNICVEEGGRTDLSAKGGDGKGTSCHSGIVGYNRSGYGGIVGYIYLNNCAYIPTKGELPIGFLDMCVGQTGSVRCLGWAYDPDDVSVPIEVHIYVGGPAGVSTFGVAFVANTLRDDVNAAFGVGSYHGFDATLNVPSTLRGKQDVYVYGINIRGGSDNHMFINKATVTIS